MSITICPPSPRNRNWRGTSRAAARFAFKPAAKEVSAPVFTSTATSAPPASGGSADGAGKSNAADPNKVWSWEEIAKHTTEDDCWVVVNGVVLDATSFLNDHPGGKGAIMLYAGKDATAEFNMLHKPDVVEKYAPEIIIGKAPPRAKM